MKLSRRQARVIVASAVAWERAYLRAMRRRGVPWVPVYRVGETVPCAHVHTTTEAVRLAEGQEATTTLEVLLHDEDWRQLAAPDRVSGGAPHE